MRVKPTDALSMLFTLHGERDNGINPSWLADDQVGFDGFLGIQFSSPQSADRIDMGDFFAGVDGVRSPRNDSHLWGGNFRLNYDSPIGQVGRLLIAIPTIIMMAHPLRLPTSIFAPK